MKELTTGKMFNISDWRCKRRWDHDILIHHCRNQSDENITSNAFKIFSYCNYFINCLKKNLFGGSEVMRRRQKGNV